MPIPHGLSLEFQQLLLCEVVEEGIELTTAVQRSAFQSSAQGLVLFRGRAQGRVHLPLRYSKGHQALIPVAQKLLRLFLMDVKSLRSRCRNFNFPGVSEGEDVPVMVRTACSARSWHAYSSRYIRRFTDLFCGATYLDGV